MRLALVAALLFVTLPLQAAAEVPEPFGFPAMADDYRAVYALEAGIWTEGQGTLNHRLSLQIPLWSASAGAVLPFGNAFGDVNDSILGNLRLYVQWFNRFAVAPRTAVMAGFGIDGYAPTATRFAGQDPVAALLSGPTVGDATLYAPGLTFAFRPRLHLGAELWVFSLQTFGGLAVQFVGNVANLALDWGANLAAFVTTWLALAVEVAGVSWVQEAPEWMDQRAVTLGGGLRFILPHGFRPALWVRGPVSERQTQYGVGTFIGVEIQWQHDRNWFLF